MEKMSLPFYMYCKEPSVGLFELADGRFQTIQKGAIAPLMFGYRYLLVEKALAGYLKELEIERISFNPAIMFCPDTGKELSTHTRIHVEQHFEPEQIQDLNLSGNRLLIMGEQYFFVSSELKTYLERSRFNYLRFSEGLSDFVGGIP